LRKIYPELEMLFVNQNMEMRSLSVQQDEQFEELALADNLYQDLLEFRDRFSFSGAHAQV